MAAPTVILRQKNLVLSPEDGSSSFSSEFNPVVAGLANGGFVAAWDDFLPATVDPDQSVTTVWRAFGGNGAPQGKAARPVSRNLTGDFGGLEAAVALSADRVALAWDAGNQAGSRVGVRLVDPGTGALVGREFSISAPGRGTGQDILLHGLVPLTGGRAGLLYVDRQNATPFRSQLRLAVIGSDGRRQSDVVLLQMGDFSSPSLASLGQPDTVTALLGPNAGVIAVLTRDPLSNAIALRFFDSRGRTALAPLNIGDTGGRSPLVTPLADGGAAVVWGAPDGAADSLYRVLRVSAQGKSSGTPAEIPLSGGFFGSADAIGLPDGGLLLAATVVAPGGGFRSEIAVQRVTAGGRRDGAQLSLSNPLTSYASPQLTRCGDGTVVVAYTDNAQIVASRLRLGRTAPSAILREAASGRLRDSQAVEGFAGRTAGDALIGGETSERLVVGVGRDPLRGSLGNGRPLGELDDDVLMGRPGRDRYVFTPQDLGDSDRIVGWEKGDRIRFQGLGAVTFLGADPFPGGAGLTGVRVVSGGGGTVVQLDDGDRDAFADLSIRVDGAATLRASDFLLG